LVKGKVTSNEEEISMEFSIEKGSLTLEVKVTQWFTFTIKTLDLVVVALKEEGLFIGTEKVPGYSKTNNREMPAFVSERLDYITTYLPVGSGLKLIAVQKGYCRYISKGRAHRPTDGRIVDILSGLGFPAQEVRAQMQDCKFDEIIELGGYFSV